MLSALREVTQKIRLSLGSSSAATDG